MVPSATWRAAHVHQGDLVATSPIRAVSRIRLHAHTGGASWRAVSTRSSMKGPNWIRAVTRVRSLE